MTNFTRAQKRNLAERFYVADGWQQKDIAEYFDTTAKTVSKWAKDGDWKGKREQYLSAPHNLKATILELTNDLLHCNSTEEMKKLQQKADSLAKISSALQKLDKRINVQVVISVFKEFDNWLAKEDPALAVKFLEAHKDFINYRITQEV